MLHTSRACSNTSSRGAPRAEHARAYLSAQLELNRVIPCAILGDLVDSNYINPASFSPLSPFLFHLPSQSPPESQNLHTHHAHLSSTITNSPSCLSIVENSREYPRMSSQLEYARAQGYLEQSMLEHRSLLCSSMLVCSTIRDKNNTQCMKG